MSHFGQIFKGKLMKRCFDKVEMFLIWIFINTKHFDKVKMLPLYCFDSSHLDPSPSNLSRHSHTDPRGRRTRAGLALKGSGCCPSRCGSDTCSWVLLPLGQVAGLYAVSCSGIWTGGRLAGAGVGDQSRGSRELPGIQLSSISALHPLALLSPLGFQHCNPQTRVRA